MTHPEKSPAHAFATLVDLMATLRSPEGCPWDREQTRESLQPYLIEEAYEVLQAIIEGEKDKLKEELGDLLLQVIFHAQIAQEQGEFDITEVVQTLTEKLIRRHPHVFGTQQVSSSAEVLQNWETIKQKEQKNQTVSAHLQGIPQQLPALLRAFRLQEKTAQVGFDWSSLPPVWDKVQEEMEELREAWKAKDQERMTEEMGDLLFSVVNLSRFLQVNPEIALHRTIQKFLERFHQMENLLHSQGKSLPESTLAEMDAAWEQVKQKNSVQDSLD